MPLQYPLLFPHGEMGFQIDVPYLNVQIDDDVNVPNSTEDIGTSAGSSDPDVFSSAPVKNIRKKMTMQDYYRYVCHYRCDQPNPFLCYGLLSPRLLLMHELAWMRTGYGIY